jgi:hypothetical protein
MPTGRSLLLVLALCGAAACSDTAPIDAATRRATVAALASQVVAHHIDRAAAQRIVATLRGGDYAALHDTAALAQRLSSDTGLCVTPLPRPLPWWRRLRDNAGIASYSKIAADIGYIDITQFVAPDRSARRYARAFGALSAAKTIIIDLRHNRGGDADGLQLLTSYMVDRPIHYASLARRGGAVEARWAFPQLAARPYLEQLMILIGPDTSAEAENFAFAMQAWKRATVVGRRSGGIVTASTGYPVGAHLVAAIPAARVTLPLTGTTWEGGVQPDISTGVTSGPDALREAKRRILTDRLAHVTTPMGRQALLALLNNL